MVWRRWPRQIASDLRRFFTKDIADWHQGRMSSYELLELFGISLEDDPDTKTRTIRVDFAPDDGALATALRGGEIPEWQQMIRQSANTLAVLRAAQVPGAQSEEYGERLFFPLSKIIEIDDEERRRHAEEKRLRDLGIDDEMAAMWTTQPDDEEV
jgi:integrase